MAEIFKFFNSAPGDERWHYASDFADYFGDVLSSGLLHKDGTPNLLVKVNPGTMQTIVEPGKALMQGYQYKNTTPLLLTHGLPEPDVDRIDRIVLRLDKRNNARYIRLFVKEGVSAENPVAPTLQRDNYVYEISLAQIRVMANTASLEQLNLVDERMDEDLCGIVYSLISVPTSVFQQQWDLWFNSIKGGVEAEVIAWQLQEMANFDAWQAQEKADFDAWFETIQDILDGDIAASLASSISILEKQSLDFEYQTPTIAGTQIRLMKHSETSRLFFKLNESISGNITISIDNGASSKPLVDANGEAVNQLEKGFAEVVEDTSFFTLRSRGISSTELQALIAIVNEAEANESDLKTQFARAVNAVDVDGGINLPDGAAWATILAEIPNIKTGKKWASGSSSSPTVTGLDFTPSIIIVEGIDGSMLFRQFYVSPSIYNINQTWDINDIAVYIDKNSTGSTNAANTYQKHWVITPSTFSFKPRTSKFKWIAFE